MEFFDAFKDVNYEFKEFNDSVRLCHILRRFKFLDKVKPLITIYDDYIVNDGETPELVALKAYGNERYHWIVLLFNERIDPFLDWVMPVQVFNEFVETKWADNLHDAHHYEVNGKVCPQGTTNAVEISNWEYEYLR
nr:baseplate wedge protein 53 [Coprothermobacter proteolyticus]